MSDQVAHLPIVVDIDGLLIRSRWLDEALLELLRTRPLEFLKVIRLRLSGSSAASASIARNAELDVDFWPVNPEFLAYLASEAERGRCIVLATSALDRVTTAFARKHPFLSEVVRLPENATSQQKADALAKAFPEGFVYAGATTDDAPVWRMAAGRLAVNLDDRARRRLESVGFGSTFDAAGLGLWAHMRALRPHQWAKNLLILVPLFLGGRGHEPTAWLNALTGALAISLVASAMYLVNDLLDLPSDRRHWSKKARPIASGEVSIRQAAAIAMALVLIGLGLAVSHGSDAVNVVLVYMVLTLLYSAYWKSVPILDVFVLASLFTLRLWLGIVITNVRLSPWLLVFSMFLFLSLSLAKRHTEVLRLHAHGLTATPGRAYRAEDAPLILALGVASAIAGVLIMILYLIEDAFPRQQYAEPQFLWAGPPILFLFLGRLWLLCQRGELNDDPVAFAMRDGVSLALGAAIVAVALLALAGTGLT
jgi:4-hydroxybenzoate polyprenyltransferase